MCACICCHSVSINLCCGISRVQTQHCQGHSTCWQPLHTVVPLPLTQNIHFSSKAQRSTEWPRSLWFIPTAIGVTLWHLLLRLNSSGTRWKSCQPAPLGLWGIGRVSYGPVSVTGWRLTRSCLCSHHHSAAFLSILPLKKKKKFDITMPPELSFCLLTVVRAHDAAAIPLCLWLTTLSGSLWFQWNMEHTWKMDAVRQGKLPLRYCLLSV